MNFGRIRALAEPYVWQIVNSEPWSTWVLQILPNEIKIPSISLPEIKRNSEAISVTVKIPKLELKQVSLQKLKAKSFEKKYIIYLILLLIGIVLSTVPFGWNGSTVTYLGLIVPQSGSPEEVKTKHLFMLSSCVWLIISICYLFLGVLFPLGKSFWINQMLWLRMTTCLPHEVTAARIVWVGISALLFGSLELFWGFFAAFLTHISFKPLFLDAVALFAYFLISGAIVIFLNTILDLSSRLNFLGSILIAVIALLSPLISLIIYGTLMTINENSIYAKHFPYTAPMSIIYSLPEKFHHIFITVFLALFLSIFSWGIQYINYKMSKNSININFLFVQSIQLFNQSLQKYKKNKAI